MTTDALWDGIAGIVLDAVGTLIEPVPSVAEVYLAAARRQGLDLDPDTVRSRFRHAFAADEVNEARAPQATDEDNELRRWRRIVGNVLVEVPDAERAFEELWSHFARPEAWRCFPDVAPAIEALKSAGLRIAIGSNFDARLRAIIGGLPSLAAADIVPVISSEVGFRKPHRQFFSAACDALDLAPSCILCVGDDVENDVRGAARAGLREVWLDRRNRGTDEEVPVVSSLTALVAGLRR
jgi:putative hydrolase of the HAD superfamily